MDFNGQIVEATVSDTNETNIFAQYEGLTLACNAAEFEKMPEVGDTLKGFAYEDEHHHGRITTKMPKISESQYAFCEVVQIRRDLGVFVDVGLEDKDVVVSLDQLPLEGFLWPSRGDRLMIRLKIDNKHRMWGDLAQPNLFQQLSRRTKEDMKNKNVEVTVFQLKKVGTFVFTDERQIGFIHPSERDVEPRLGQVLQARVIGIRDDGELNLSLKPRAYEAISDDAAMLLAIMKHNREHKLALTDKSAPEEIKMQLDISKGAFKRAVGHLLKARYITQHDGVIELTEDGLNAEN